MQTYKMYVNGKWVESSSSQTFPTVNPFTMETWAEIPDATEADVNDAVAAARNAFEQTWRKTSGLERATLINRLAELLDADADRLAEIETRDSGKIIRETKSQMHFAARNYRFMAGYADKLYGEVIPLDNLQNFDYTIREPLGVAVLITAWNAPIQLLANKLPPALAAGNTVVIKPSEYTSASTLEFAALVERAGFPPGVVNVVTGGGNVGRWLTAHPDVNKVSFTGGPATGRLIAKNAAEHLASVTLELGGKSANIIFDDANIEKALPAAFTGIFSGSGQVCIAGSRLLVQRGLYETVVERIAERAKKIRLGNPMDLETEMGPVAYAGQRDRIMRYVDFGLEQGARLMAGGTTDVGISPGLFIAPTVFADVKPTMTIAQEEIFGPVLGILPFNDEEEAIQIANSTMYGLASGVWTRNLRRAHVMAREMRSGVVWINTYRSSSAQAPFGGMKQSGYGRERGWHALLEYTQMKNVVIDLSD